MPWYRYNMNCGRAVYTCKKKKTETILVGFYFLLVIICSCLYIHIHIFGFFCKGEEPRYVTATYAVSLKDFRLPSHNVIEKIGKNREKKSTSVTDGYKKAALLTVVPRYWTGLSTAGMCMCVWILSDGYAAGVRGGRVRQF